MIKIIIENFEPFLQFLYEEGGISVMLRNFGRSQIFRFWRHKITPQKAEGKSRNSIFVKCLLPHTTNPIMFTRNLWLLCSTFVSSLTCSNSVKNSREKNSEKENYEIFGLFDYWRWEIPKFHHKFSNNLKIGLITHSPTLPSCRFADSSMKNFWLTIFTKVLLVSKGKSKWKNLNASCN